jgi:hypothetical protein
MVTICPSASRSFSHRPMDDEMYYDEDDEDEDEAEDEEDDK